MNLKLLASGVAALGMLALASTIQPAQARFGGGHHGGGTFAGHMHGYHGGHFEGRHFDGGHRFRHFGFRDHRFHRFHRHGFVFLGFDPYYPYYYYDEGCYWLRRRALYTGSAYWWRRYRACSYGYGY